MIKNTRPIIGTVSALLGLAALVPASPSAAQAKPPEKVATSAAPTIGSPLDGSRVPDVQIVAILVPAGPQTGLWAVSAVYPKKVDRTVAEGRMRRLLGLTGWNSSPLEFENRALERAELSMDLKTKLDRPLEAVPVMTSVSFTTPDRVVDGIGGTIAVEPFIRAYRDLSRLHITYLVPPQGFNFRGLRSFSDGNVNIVLSGAGNAYTYVVDVKNHSLDVLNLPRIQEVNGTGKTPAVGKEMPRGIAVTIVTLVALGIGGLVFIVLRR